MKNDLTLLIIAAGFIGVFFLARRNRARAYSAAENRRANMAPGTDVMTTSGLYGTVIRVNDDNTVLLSIAPGIEVKWALPGIRDISEVPGQYGRAAGGAGTAVPEPMWEPHSELRSEPQGEHEMTDEPPEAESGPTSTPRP